MTISFDGTGNMIVNLESEGQGKFTFSKHIPLDGEWRHLYVSFDGKDIQTYIDGALLEPEG